MASTVTNGPGVPVIRRNAPTNMGQITAVTQVVAFTIMIPVSTPNGNDLITVVTTGAITTGAVVMEATLDGVTWFGVPSSAASSNQSVNLSTTTLNSDTAVSAAGSFNVSGLQGAQFRVGVTGTITVNPNIWVLLG